MEICNIIAYEYYTDSYLIEQLIESWNFPDDTLDIMDDLDNLHLSLGIVKGSVEDFKINGVLWSYPSVVNPVGYVAFSYSDSLGAKDQYNISYKNSSEFGFSDNYQNITNK